MTREQKMNNRKAAGKTYAYEPIPYAKGSSEYREEKRNRKRKNVSHKTPLQKWTSIMKKLDNQILEEKMKRAKTKKSHK